jgi:hypothetical protein
MFSGSIVGERFVPRAARRPTGKALRNPADPIQAERIQDAADKRTRKGVVLMSNAGRSAILNKAHQYAGAGLWLGRRLDPLHVAK